MPLVIRFSGNDDEKLSKVLRARQRGSSYSVETYSSRWFTYKARSFYKHFTLLKEVQQL